MARQLNVSLVFNANVTQAKQQMNSLQTSIQQIQNSLNQKISMKGLTAELSQAQNSIAALKTNLNSAFDVNTGKLDMNKFNQNMAISNQSVQQYRIALQQMGPEGVRAFNQLSQAVLQAQMPMHQTKNILTTMMDTFGNSIKWSIAYGAINKVTQGMREAYGYAKDLNSSLTNIRVVTGLGAEEMAEFAQQANKAAKSLATSTKAYTDAALIYYQQGLEGKAVAKRAEITLKLANVTGQSAEEISQNLTAVWNNFYDGSQSLEYYADVMTALGAATASSSKEIAEGLEKFAAVADTVGLSYEYATTALATVTAQTRQSADVVGTAFKTLFARIQDLELGDTLEDGTTLGTYSEALAKVGINIKDANGGLKDMDTILDEMGEKWQQIDKDQQVALAKSVAGIRQYTQLIALMDNWSTFQVNLSVAENAEGTLQEQQDIWAESWEAASKRVRASAEELYTTLINDKFFINLNNVFADLISALNKMLDTMGGLKTLLPLIASWILKAFGPAAIGAVGGFMTSLRGPTAAQQKAATDTRSQVMRQQTEIANANAGQVGTAMSQTLPKQQELVQAIEGINRRLNKQEVERLQLLVQQSAEIQEQVLKAAELADTLSAENDQLASEKIAGKAMANSALNELKQGATQEQKDAIKKAKGIMKTARADEVKSANFQNSSFYNQDGSFNQGSAQAAFDHLKESESLQGAIQSTKIKKITTPEDLNKIKAALKGVDVSAKAAEKSQTLLNKAFPNGSKAVEKYVKGTTKANKASAKMAANNKVITRSEKNVEKAIKDTNKQMDGFIDEATAMQKVPLSQTITSAASSFGMLFSGVNMVTNGLKTLFDAEQELTFGTVIGALSSIGMGVGMLIPAFTSLNTTLGITNGILALSETIAMARVATDQIQEASIMKLVAAENTRALATMFGTTTDKAAIMLKSLKAGATVAEAAAEAGLAGSTGGATAATWSQTVANMGLLATFPPLLAVVLIIMAAFAALAITILAVVAAVKIFTKINNADAMAAEKAAENAKKLKAAYEEMKEAYDSLIQKIADRQEAIDSLKELTKGTIEWSNALIEANAKTLELISNYPELQKFVSTSKDGLLEISQEGLDYVKEVAQERVFTSYGAMLSGDVAAQRAKNKFEQTKKRREMFGDVGEGIKNIAIDDAIAVLGATPGTMIGLPLMSLEIIKTAIALNKNIRGGAGLEVAKRGLKKDSAALNSYQDFSRMMHVQGFHDELMIKELYDNKAVLEDILENDRLLGEKQLAAAQATVASIAQNNELLQASGHADNASKIVSKQYLEYEEKYYKEYLKKANNEKTVEEYMNLMGYSDKSGFKITDYDDDGNIAYKYLNEDGEYEEKIVTAEEIATTLASNQASQQVDNILDKWAIKLYGKSENQVAEFSNVASGDARGISGRDLAKYDNPEEYLSEFGLDKQSLGFGEGQEYQYRKYLKNFYGINLSAIEETYAEAQNLIQENQKNLETAVSQEALGKAQSLIGNMDAKGGEAFVKTLQDLTDFYGNTNMSDALIETTSGYEAMLGNDQEAVNAFYDALGNVTDVTDAEQWDALAEAMEESGTLTKAQTDALKAYTESAKMAAAATRTLNFEEFSKEMVALEEVISKALSGTVDYTQEEYDAMIKQGGLDPDKFAKTLEGYRYLGEAGELAQELGQAQTKTLETSLQEYYNSRDKYLQAAENTREAIAALEEEEDEFANIKAIFNAFMEALRTLLNSLKKLIMVPIKILNNLIVSAYDAAVSIINEIIEGFMNFLEKIKGLLVLLDNWLGTKLADFVENNKTPGKLKTSGELLAAEKMKKEAEEKERAENNHREILKSIESSADLYDTVADIEAQKLQAMAKLASLESAYETAKASGDTEQVENLEDTITKQKEIIDAWGKAIASKQRSIQQALEGLDLLTLEDEIDFFHEVLELIDDINRELDILAAKKEKAFGANKLSYMDAEIKKQNELIKAQQRYYDEAKEKFLEQRQLITSKYGASLDSDGRIVNYEELFQVQIDAVNDARRKNTMGLLSDEDLAATEKNYEIFKENIERYETFLNTMEETQQTLLEQQQQLIDLKLEKVEYKVQLNIETDEFTLEYLEHALSRLEDDAFAAADAIALIGQQMEVTAGQIDTYMNGIQETLGATLSQEEINKIMSGDLSGIDTSKLTEQQIEDLKEYANGLMEVENQLREQHTAVHEKLTETIEAWNEEFDRNMAKFEKYSAVIENYKNIIDIVGKDRLGISDETMKNMYATQKEIAKDQLEASRARKEAAQNTYDEVKTAYEDAVKQYGEDSEIAKKWKEQMDAAEETLTDATSEFYDSWQNALQAAADAFAASVELVVENFEEKVSGIYGSIEAMQEAFERQQEINERFLDDYEKVYEINKLNRKINQDIAKTTSTKASRELKELSQELLALNEKGVNVSQRDIEFMQKKYDLLLAEQALRDAQEAKSIVRLRRDSEGNYNYVYTADQNNIDAAQQAYEDARYNLEKWNEESLNTISEQIITIKENFSQAISDIANDATLSDEERKQKMAETTAYYVEKLQYWTDEATKLNEYAYSANSQFHMDMADSIHESIIGQIFPDLQDWTEFYETDTMAMMDASEELSAAIDEMSKSIEDAMQAAGTSIDDFEDEANREFENVQQDAKDTKGEVEELVNTISTELPKATAAVSLFEKSFNGYMDNIQSKIDDVVIPAIQRLINKCKDGLRAQQALEEKDYSYTGEEVPPSTTGKGPITTGVEGDDTVFPDTKTPTTWTVSTVGGRNYLTVGYDDGTTAVYSKGGLSDEEWSEFQKTGKINPNWINSPIKYLNTSVISDLSTLLEEMQADSGVEITKTGVIYTGFNQKEGLIGETKFTDAGNHPNVTISDIVEWNGKAYAKGKVWKHAGNGVEKDETYWIPVDMLNKGRSFDYYSYDTGGYTGSWGPEGRLAMLHQKEIVLNAHDTENLLSIISMVRDMSDRIEVNARAMQYGLTAAYTANNINPHTDTLQQEVTIHAEFPNATNHSEIEEAFRNLNNLASQYANRKF